MFIVVRLPLTGAAVLPPPTAPRPLLFSRRFPESPAPPTSKHTAPVACSSSAQRLRCEFLPAARRCELHTMRAKLWYLLTHCARASSSRETNAGEEDEAFAGIPVSLGQMLCIAAATPPGAFCSASNSFGLMTAETCRGNGCTKKIYKYKYV